jgi:hypothetical protein
MMKKLLLLLMLIITSNSLSAQFGGGSGTEIDPYLISTKEHLQEITDSIVASRYPNAFVGKYFTLTQDITDSVRVPVGCIIDPNSTYSSAYFTHFFNGAGHKITLAISGDTLPYNMQGLGLFLMLGNGKIENLTVDGYITVKSLSLISAAIGGIVGWVRDGDIFNCVNKANISSSIGGSIGGIAGTHNVGNIANCQNYGTIRIIDESFAGFDFMGGICGNGDSISNCINYGLVSSLHSRCHICGGICGTGGKVLNCVNVGIVKSSAHNVGGICGIGYTIIGCINYGFISAYDFEGYNLVGGIAGLIFLMVSDCFNSGVISNSGEITGCIVGEKHETATVTNCHYDKQMCD